RSWRSYPNTAMIGPTRSTSDGTTNPGLWGSKVISDDLKRQLLKFRDDRDWRQFHNLRTLSVSIALEAAELMELTQWSRDGELTALASEKRERVGEEAADIAILLTYLVEDLGLDLEAEVQRKLQINARKYPV